MIYSVNPVYLVSMEMLLMANQRHVLIHTNFTLQYFILSLNKSKKMQKNS